MNGYYLGLGIAAPDSLSQDFSLPLSFEANLGNSADRSFFSLMSFLTL
jgi:hypothetical protein